MSSRSRFLYIASSAAVVGCAGGSSPLLFGRSSDARRAISPGIICATDCGGGGGGGTYKYTSSVLASNGQQAIVRYNKPTALVTSGLDPNGNTLFAGTSTSTLNSDNSLTTQHAINFAGGASGSVGYTLPGSVPNNGTLRFLDSNGVTHTLTTTTYGSTITVIDTATLNGKTCTVQCVTSGQSASISYSSPLGSGSYTLQLPTAYQPTIMASVATMHNDFAKFKSGEEIAIAASCASLAQAAELTGSAGALLGFISLGLLGSGIGAPLGAVFGAVGALTGAFGAICGLIHAMSCY